jgi:hypothetical protein
MTDTVSYPDKPLDGAMLMSQQHGGYTIYRTYRDGGGYSANIASFSTLDEALKWLKKAMER